MSKLTGLIQAPLTFLKPRQACDETCVDDAVDVLDLVHRMRNLEARDRAKSLGAELSHAFR